MENQQVLKFMNGLKHSIRDKLGLQVIHTFEHAHNLALRAEYLDKQGNNSGFYCRNEETYVSSTINPKVHITNYNASCITTYSTNLNASAKQITSNLEDSEHSISRTFYKAILTSMRHLHLETSIDAVNLGIVPIYILSTEW